MGLFNFSKNNAAPAQEMPVQAPPIEHKPIETLGAQPVMPVARPEIERRKMPPPMPVKEKKQSIGDFFNIKLDNIFSLSPESEGRQQYEKGQWLEVFNIKFKKPELGCFDRAHILLYDNGRYDLIFRSDTTEVNDALEEFIYFCLDTFGADFSGKGKITERDYNDFNMGIFSRTWLNKVRIDNIYLSVCVTIYNIEQQKI